MKKKIKGRELLSKFLAGVVAVSMLPLSAVTVNAADETRTVNVKVTATQKSNGEVVPVNGAWVSVFYGQGRKDENVEYQGSFESGEDGYAKCEIKIPGDIAGDEDKVNEYLSHLTFSASKTVAHGKGIDGTARDALFNSYKNHGNDRLQLELHSETIDSNGNWLGKKLPIGNGRDVDLAFVIDTTSSMQNSINNVKNNITQFAKHLEEQGLNLRMSVVEYRDISVDGNNSTKLHYNVYSPWHNTTDKLIETLNKVNVAGGGDADETPIDALNALLYQEDMNWRSSANKFAFLLTDAGYKVTNSHGYGSMQEIADLLYEENVMTSVISQTNYRDTYADLYKTTGGQYVNINSSDFAAELNTLADGIIGKANKELELHLSEPRLLADMSVCYYADDEKSRSDGYYNMVADRMRDYSNFLAESTDGHVLIKNIYVFNTDNRDNFYIRCDNSGNADYSTATLPSMADIHIITKVRDDGVGVANPTINSNSRVAGFFSDESVDTDSEWFENFKNLDQLIDGKKQFYNMSFSGTNMNSKKLSESDYSREITHETGHYLMGFNDEYLDCDGKKWRYYGYDKCIAEWGKENLGDNYRPYDNFGLMDDQYEDIELSKDCIDYEYLFSNTTISPQVERISTYQYWYSGMSCESALAYLLENGAEPLSRMYIQNIVNTTEETDENRDIQNARREWLEDYNNQTYAYKLFDFIDKDYVISYSLTKRSPHTAFINDARDKTAKYPYATCNVIDWTDETQNMVISGVVNLLGAADVSLTSYTDNTETSQNLADITITECQENNIVLNINKNIGENLMLYARKANGLNDSEIESIPINNNQAILPLGNGRSCELTIVSEDHGVNLSNTHIIERSLKSNKGYYYKSNDFSVAGYVIPSSENEYTFMTINHSYKNGDYSSVNNALMITPDNTAVNCKGEIYSVASVNGNIDYSTISWFKYDGRTWTKLDTDLSTEENMNIGACCDYAGEGTYVLMAKAASDKELKPVTDIEYTNPTDRDGIVNLTFKDSNAETVYYNIYYSDTKFTSESDSNVVMKKAYAGEDYYSINLGERNMDGYVAVVAVDGNGAKSPLSDVVKVNTGEADRDGDGIPDWYCDEYLLWPPSGEEKDIANSDDDKDGLTNLQEYKGGSDPTDPDDPVRTSNVAVKSVKINKTSVSVKTGNTVKVTAELNPSDASNKNIRWHTDNEAIATVSGSGTVCTIKGVGKGSTKVTAVTEDGGYTASVDVNVSNSTGGGSSSSRLSQVKADVSPGTVKKGTKVTLSNSTDGAVIYYTTDGSTPTTSSKKYTEPITINEDVTIKAIAVKSGYSNSTAALFKYKVSGTPCFVLKEDASEIKYMTSYDDGTFKPDQAATRYEVLTALNNLFNFENITDSIVFSDVTANNKALVNKFACTGVINGYGDKTFRGNNGITRAEMVKILSIMFDVESSGTPVYYSDAVGHWAASYISSFAKEGYIEGYPDRTFKPNNNVTRAEFVRIVNNILGIDGNSETGYIYNGISKGYGSSLDAAASDISGHWAQKDIESVTK